MFDLIAGVVAWFYSLVPSYGFAIMMLTLSVMIVVTPLTLKGTRSMLQMQLLQPELKRIQGKYGPGERAQMNEELMAFYQENGINPLGGCLPLLVQLPVFLVLFRVVQGMTRRATDLGTQLGWTARRDITTGPFDSEVLNSTEHLFDPEYIPGGSQLFDDLTDDERNGVVRRRSFAIGQQRGRGRADRRAPLHGDDPRRVVLESLPATSDPRS